MITTNGFISYNLSMTRPAGAPLRRVLQAPFTRRAWDELAHTVVSALLAVCALIFIVPTLINGPLWALSAPGVRKLGAGGRRLARRLLGEDVLAPPPPQPALLFKVRMANPEQLAVAATAAGATARVWDSKRGITIRKIPSSLISELAAGADLAIDEIRPFKRRSGGWPHGSSIASPGGPAATSRSRSRWPGSAWRSPPDAGSAACTS